jgi:hypothetical protein
MVRFYLRHGGNRSVDPDEVFRVLGSMVEDEYDWGVKHNNFRMVIASWSFFRLMQENAASSELFEKSKKDAVETLKSYQDHSARALAQLTESEMANHIDVDAMTLRTAFMRGEDCAQSRSLDDSDFFESLETRYVKLFSPLPPDEAHKKARGYVDLVVAYFKDLDAKAEAEAEKKTRERFGPP